MLLLLFQNYLSTSISSSVLPFVSSGLARSVKSGIIISRPANIQKPDISMNIVSNTDASSGPTTYPSRAPVMHTPTLVDLTSFGNIFPMGYILFCHPDIVIAEAMHPSRKLERSKTLMQGDKHCDREYSWNERFTLVIM